jgi:hypothetical protein
MPGADAARAEAGWEPASVYGCDATLDFLPIS